MKNILMTVTPTPGHVTPMLAIACHLRDRGHSVLFNTAEVFREEVESEDLRFIPLQGKANFDHRDFNKFLPEGVTLTPGPEELIHDGKHVMGDTMLPQYDGIREIMRREPVDLILSDLIFFGVLPLLLRPRAERPPIISVSPTPLVLTSNDASPFAPAITIEEKEKGRQETALFQSSVGCVNKYLDRLLRSCGSPPLPGFFLDCIFTLPDLLLQLSAEQLEFPRTDLPPNIKFVGPVLPKPSSAFTPPDWWKKLHGGRPVILVTQGTVANRDLSKLIAPTLAALSTEDMIVIAATGKQDGIETDAIPPNAIVTSFIPFIEVLPKVDVFVTNGGFGAVNQALAQGVPMVIAGQTEDKAFVAARVAWTGSGINLETSHPTLEQIRSAVRKVLNDSSYRTNARRLQANFAQYDALNRIAQYVESFLFQVADPVPLASSQFLTQGESL